MSGLVIQWVAIRRAVETCRIKVLTLRTILSAAVERAPRKCAPWNLKNRSLMKVRWRLGILVSQDSDSDGSVSAKPFIDNMIHVIRECRTRSF